MEAPGLHAPLMGPVDGTGGLKQRNQTDACSSPCDLPVEQLLFTTFLTLLPTTKAFDLGKHDMILDAPATNFQETSIKINANENSTFNGPISKGPPPPLKQTGDPL